MREIKFRGWGEHEKIMIYGVTNMYKKWDEPIEDLLNDSMQYTGLKDKNGREIYEGDIVKYDLYEVERFPPRIGFIGWDDYYLGLAINDQRGNYIELKADLWIEVIGNVFENGDLLCQ